VTVTAILTVFKSHI